MYNVAKEMEPNTGPLEYKSFYFHFILEGLQV